ncbi:hypothetical protein [Tropicibacter naphthalenivorans]|uniref:DUF4268 domain-containing protein n=1 Tax=Tropicibacter naphthalenivorans TaxID=441103 RepID=A0A0N7LZ94_9RHOB|nr:hypothetical protein [Tropicibacter naphthalenivorans]CUH77033.1 hypothetical protein TRN7648_01258 [Tropicibacter naphthalenivorans]SMC61414.1 hypothetical protein SAMN04488093_102360 [Tropicibacter naphthalenivorans]
MYRIDRSGNRLQKLPETTLSDVSFRERDHLQEWIATDPLALGEELLIIQKEFDGFDGTRERLDLLALDKEGRLVIIENKLDDSGRDVVWQALKYAAYCSTMQKSEIVSAFQAYLDRYDPGTSASDSLCDFLGEETLDDVILNDGTGQRVIMVATDFRKEVTSTVLWLRDYGIDARCIKVKPYRLDDDVLIDLQQVIPPPEAADYMIRMAQKETEAKKTATMVSYQGRMEYWGAFLEAYGDASDLIPPSRAPNQGWMNLKFPPDLRTESGAASIVLYRNLKNDRVGAYLSIGKHEEEDIERWLSALASYPSLVDAESECSPKGVWGLYVTLDADALDEEDWPRQHEWMQAQALRFLADWQAGLREDFIRLCQGEVTA